MKTVDWEKPQRQSSVVLLIIILEGIKQIWPWILLGFLRTIFKSKDESKPLDRQLLIVFISSILVLVLIKTKQIISYFTFRFLLQQNLLLVEKGFFTKVKTEIPFEKIQAIHQNQTFLHRLTNTCELIISTSGTSKEEINIKGISLENARHLKGLLSSKADIDTSETEQPALTEQVNSISLTGKDLLKLCLSENHLKTLLIILAFILDRFQDLQEYLGFDSVGWVEQQSNLLQTTSILSFLILAGVFLSVIVSSIRVVLRYFNFNIRLQTGQFFMSWGLIETKEKKIRFSRIKLLSWNANYVRRKLQLYIMRVWVMSEDNTERNTSNNIPITSADQIQRITSWYQPVLPSAVSTAFEIEAAYTKRKTLLFGIVPAIVAGFSLFPFVGWNALFVIAWTIYFAIRTHVFRKNFRIWIHEDAIEIEKGVWGREHILLNLNDAESVAVESSLYQRRNGLANLRINTSAKPVHIPFLQQNLAAFLADFILYRIEFNKSVAETTDSSNQGSFSSRIMNYCLNMSGCTSSHVVAC